MRLIGILAGRSMTVNEIAEELGVSQPNASVHVRVLEETGLLDSQVFPTAKGAVKRCWLTFDRIVIEPARTVSAATEEVREISIPIGLFTALSVPDGPLSGWASDSGLVMGAGRTDLLSTRRTEAQIIWLRAGWLEYTLPVAIPSQSEVTAVEFEAEICSETGRYNNDYPSDITVWINGVETATWTSPGDFGGIRGRVTPEWWADTWTQYGLLKTWRVDATGTSVDGELLSSTSIADLGIVADGSLLLRIGVKEDAKHAGGLNIFGRHFGNYPQDPVLRLRYTSHLS